MENVKNQNVVPRYLGDFVEQFGEDGGGEVNLGDQVTEDHEGCCGEVDMGGVDSSDKRRQQMSHLHNTLP